MCAAGGGAGGACLVHPVPRHPPACPLPACLPACTTHSHHSLLLCGRFANPLFFLLPSRAAAPCRCRRARHAKFVRPCLPGGSSLAQASQPRPSGSPCLVFFDHVLNAASSTTQPPQPPRTPPPLPHPTQQASVNLSCCPALSATPPAAPQLASRGAPTRAYPPPPPNHQGFPSPTHPSPLHPFTSLIVSHRCIRFCFPHPDLGPRRAPGLASCRCRGATITRCRRAFFPCSYLPLPTPLPMAPSLFLPNSRSRPPPCFLAGCGRAAARPPSGPAPAPPPWGFGPLARGPRLLPPPSLPPFSNWHAAVT